MIRQSGHPAHEAGTEAGRCQLAIGRLEVRIEPVHQELRRITRNPERHALPVQAFDKPSVLVLEP